jgi:hypothetical protein
MKRNNFFDFSGRIVHIKVRLFPKKKNFFNFLKNETTYWTFQVESDQETQAEVLRQVSLSGE